MVQQNKLQELDDTEIYLHERELVLPQLRELISEKNRYKALLDEALIDHNKLESCLRKTRLELEHVTTLQLEAPQLNQIKSRKNVVGLVVVGFALGAILSAGYWYTVLRKDVQPSLVIVEATDTTSDDSVVAVNVEPKDAVTIEELPPTVISSVAKVEEVDTVVVKDSVITEVKSQSIPIVVESSSSWVAAGSEFNVSPNLSIAVKEKKIIPSVADLSVYDRTVIFSTIRNWADAWSQQDLPTYLSYYSASYIPEGDISYQQWLERRKLRLQRTGGINVGVSGAKIGLVEKNRVQVKFKQSYQSEGYSDQINKSINLVNETGGWKILTERSLGKVTATN